MYTIIEHIEYLLTSHDCVVIPGWGALVAQYTDSYYAPAAGHIERPRRKLGFNASVDHNDGLLAQSLVRREHIPYSEAMRFIGQSVSAFRAQLAQGNEVSMGRLGYFHSADGRRIEFTPFQHEQSNDAYFGLRSVEFRPLAEEAARAQAVAAAAAAFEQNANAPRTLWNRRVARIAASIAVLLSLSIVAEDLSVLSILKVRYLYSCVLPMVPPLMVMSTWPRPFVKYDEPSVPSSFLSSSRISP